MLQRTEQTLEKFCIAAMCSEMHKNNVCPANHNVAYDGDAMFYIDGEPFERFDLEREGQERYENGDDYVLYSSLWNTYVFAPY